MIKHLHIVRSMALFCAVFSWLSAVPSFAQVPAQSDTLLIKFGKKSALSLVLADDQDLSILPEIDFNRMVDSLAYYLQLAKQRDLSYLAVQGKVADYAIRVNTSPAPPTKPKNIVQITSGLFKEKSDEHQLRRTQSGFSLSFGFNNVLENGKVPTRTAYDLRPMGSRYVDVGYRGGTYLTGKRHLYKKDFREVRRVDPFLQLHVRERSAVGARPRPTHVHHRNIPAGKIEADRCLPHRAANFPLPFQQALADWGGAVCRLPFIELHQNQVPPRWGNGTAQTKRSLWAEPCAVRPTGGIGH